VIPAVVVTRVLRSPQWAQHRASMPAGTLAWLLVGATVIALGEAAGYLAGAGSAPGRVAKYELHRARYL
jgi:hypothetical protein